MATQMLWLPIIWPQLHNNPSIKAIKDQYANLPEHPSQSIIWRLESASVVCMGKQQYETRTDAPF